MSNVELSSELVGLSIADLKENGVRVSYRNYKKVAEQLAMFDIKGNDFSRVVGSLLLVAEGDCGESDRLEVIKYNDIESSSGRLISLETVLFDGELVGDVVNVYRIDGLYIHDWDRHTNVFTSLDVFESGTSDRLVTYLKIEADRVNDRRELEKSLLDDSLVDMLLMLPCELFYGIGEVGSAWLFGKDKVDEGVRRVSGRSYNRLKTELSEVFEYGGIPYRYEKLTYDGDVMFEVIAVGSRVVRVLFEVSSYVPRGASQDEIDALPRNQVLRYVNGISQG